MKMASCLTDAQFWEQMRLLTWKAEESVDATDGIFPVFHKIIDSFHPNLQDKFELLEKALEMGADINGVSKNTMCSSTPLMYVTRASTGAPTDIVDITRWLIGHGADVNVLDSEGENVAFWCLLLPHVNILPDLLPLYLDAGLDITLVSDISGEQLEDDERIKPIIEAWHIQKQKEALQASLAESRCPTRLKSKL